MRENYIDEKIESAIAHLADKVAYRDNLVVDVKDCIDWVEVEDITAYAECQADDAVNRAVHELYKLGVSPKSARLLLAQLGVDELQVRIDCN